MFRKQQKPNPLIGIFLKPKPKQRSYTKAKKGAVVGAIVGTGMYLGLKNQGRAS